MNKKGQLRESDWRRELYKPANYVTLARILASLICYGLLAAGNMFWFTIVYIIGGLTDAVDGYLARKFWQQSSFGAWFDSFADQVFYVSSAIWLFWLYPDIFAQARGAFVVIFGGLFLYLATKLLLTSRMTFLHLWPSKVAAVALFILMTIILLFGFHPWMAWAYVPVLGFALLYELRLLSRHDDTLEGP